tara:strand:+ start:141 stop:302 length:162 start_codon:yes stop_codon:yes gene_type:complete
MVLQLSYTAHRFLREKKIDKKKDIFFIFFCVKIAKSEITAFFEIMRILFCYYF